MQERDLTVGLSIRTEHRDETGGCLDDAEPPVPRRDRVLSADEVVLTVLSGPGTTLAESSRAQAPAVVGQR